MRVLLLLVFAAIVGCTNVTLEDPDMPKGPHGPIFGAAKFSKSLDIVPSLATGAEPVAPGAGGVGATPCFLFTQEIPLFSAEGMKADDSETVVLTIDANPTGAPAGASADVVMNQAIVEFAEGTSLFGTGANPTTTTNATPIPTKIIFDVYQGTQIVFPAQVIRVSFRYVAMRRAAAGAFPAGSTVGPPVKVNAHLGYGTRDTFGMVTVTSPFCDLPAGGAGFYNVARAKFAQALEVNWTPYAGAAAATPIQVTFSSGFGGGSNVWDVQIAANTQPPPRLPWPAGADVVSISDLHGANAAPRLSVKQYLSL